MAMEAQKASERRLGVFGVGRSMLNVQQLDATLRGGWQVTSNIERPTSNFEIGKGRIEALRP